MPAGDELAGFSIGAPGRTLGVKHGIVLIELLTQVVRDYFKVCSYSQRTLSPEVSSDCTVA